MTYKKFIEDWYDYILPDKEPEIRMGQSLMIYLEEIWPDEYYRIIEDDFRFNTNLDCFYKDSNIPNTMDHLEKNWHKYPN